MPKAPKAPSYAKIIKAIRKQTRVANKQRKKAQEWGREVYAAGKAVSDDVVANLNDIMATQTQFAKDVQTRVKDVFWPLEDEQKAEIDKFQQRAADFDAEVAQLKADAIQFKSEANQAYRAGKAQADVGQAFAQERAGVERALLDRGVNPNSGASMSLVSGIRLAEGAAQAAAGTQAADATRQEGDARYQQALDRQIQAGAIDETGLGLQAGLIGQGANYPGYASQSTGQATGAGAAAVDATMAPLDASTRARSLAPEWARIASGNLQTWTDAVSKDFENRLGLYKTQSEVEAAETSGVGAALGVGAGVLKAFLADGGVVPHFDGGGVNDPNLSMTGGSTGNYSPTGRMAAATQQPPPSGIDTVPARLTAGEFVVPKHVVDWKGQEYFQKLIKSAPEQKQQMIAQTGAQADIRRAGALPV